MKTFVIFPAIGIFFLVFALLKYSFGFIVKKNIFWSLIFTSVLSILMTLYSEKLFGFIYFLNFLFVPILAFSITYLTNDILPKTIGKTFFVRLFGISLLATLVSILIFAVLMFYSFMYNPMDY